jgi:hypothetical protein
MKVGIARLLETASGSPSEYKIHLKGIGCSGPEIDFRKVFMASMSD